MSIITEIVCLCEDFLGGGAVWKEVMYMRMLYFTFNFSKTVIKFSIKKYSMSKVFSMYGLRTLNMGKKMELKDL